MFLVRSAFWLTVAFIALHPRDVDLGAAASAISGRALAAGQQLVAAEFLASDCALAHCGPPAASAVPASRAAGRTVPSVGNPHAGFRRFRTRPPFPRPRPVRMG